MDTKSPQAQRYMHLLDAMPDIPQHRFHRLIFAFEISTWARHGCRDAMLCVALANKEIDENDARVLENLENVNNNPHTWLRAFERELEQTLQWEPAFAVCVACLFWDVWCWVFYHIDEEETEQTQKSIVSFCKKHGVG